MGFGRCRAVRRVAVRRLSVVVAAVVVASMVAAGPVAAQDDAGGGFTDVTEGVHKPAIDALAAMGVFDDTECAEAMFCPGDEMKRWTMGVWLVRVLDEAEPAAVSGSSFADVDADEWWLAHVERLAELGVTKGCKTEPLRFCPDRSVTRAQMATFLVRAFDLEAAEPAGFVDTAGNTHETNIDALAAAGVTAGCKTEPLSYCPSKSVTRAQMATFLARALGLLEVPQPAEDTSEPEEAPEEETPEPEEAPEEEPAGPAITVDPAAVPLAGSYDFTITGTGFDPGSTIFVRICTIPGDPVSADTPAEDLAASIDEVDRSDCDLSTAQTVSLDSSGSFSVERSAGVEPNFMWVASDSAETQSAGAPVFITGYSAMTVGAFHACGLFADGTLECNGGGDVPEGTYTAVDAGHGFTCAIRTDSTLACWGLNNYEQSEPPDGTFTAVSVGILHACGVRTDGSVECWGINTNGQADAPGGITFTDVSAGGSHTCGLRTNERVRCWGLDNNSQASPPIRTRFSAVSAGLGHTCGLHTDGTVECWGANYFDGNYTGQSDPPGGTFTTVSAGLLHSCGLRPDGTIVCWGANNVGQSDPPSGTFILLEAGGNSLTETGYSCALRNDRLTNCWGRPS